MNAQKIRASSAPARPQREAAGFTLLELTVVLGLLSAFTLFLIQILLGGVELFESRSVAPGARPVVACVSATRPAARPRTDSGHQSPRSRPDRCRLR